MIRLLRYGVACAVLVAVSAGGSALWLEPDHVRALFVAGGVAMALQVVGFGLLIAAKNHTNRFLAVWVGGTLVRFAAVGIAAWVLVRRGEPDLLTTLLGLAGYLFAMLLLEPAFLHADVHSESTRSQ